MSVDQLRVVDLVEVGCFEHLVMLDGLLDFRFRSRRELEVEDVEILPKLVLLFVLIEFYVVILELLDELDFDFLDFFDLIQIQPV